ncbi:hypothetical protein [Bacillus pseudomycoides]|uniref:hypothetical protein n=1 Tax=Bacillus pseudomycoides TaxID=64104 RepID=UPI000502013B|nr:hypothetical protein [Bacillus pseudomycoides]KFN10988.1 hypothetical protein DJ94_5441 [Bacillus pseudomycoides]MED0855676.1 hypothetical protein [Bacillus pseudomycoides]
MKKCRSCGGTSIITCFIHVEGGICFSCLGIGFLEGKEETVKKTTYTVVDWDNIETFSSEKILEKKYGKFYCGEVEGYAARISYKSCFTFCFINATKDSINAAYKRYIREAQDILENNNGISQKDPRFIKQIQERIKTFKSYLNK